MAVKRKLIGYYISGGKCLKAYNFYDKKKKRFLKQKKTATGRKILSKHKVYKKKSTCTKVLKKLKKKMEKRKKASKRFIKELNKKTSKRNKFGAKTCNVVAPFFGDYIPVNYRGWKWPGGGKLDMENQFLLRKPIKN